ncbi:RNA 2',3'-cyclic phosphodiesterase [Actinophytocola gossypii]|uniref:RNA 2',3'-cyclic phosphodiesterase n=1 Tax=Actinophytocola gossypii TaxID=2812003 RepID=A0ABT2JBC1_9PSEU|nr:RNA 2',3'-cyclic phosphodiesterase [Actinophytocola gossypii]MCT2585165.1 RNA 2',3'-cyclic phosphodiesterase [Actinophytocola gossypii]
MARLFSAIELPATVRAELADRLRDLRASDPELERELTWSPPHGWHITLGFYGDREHVDRRGAWFRRQAAGLDPARLRLRGAGRFPGVLWIGVNPMGERDAGALSGLAGALGADITADQFDFAPHVTVARWRRGGVRGERAIQASAALADFASSWWPVTEVALFRSDRDGSAPVYTAVDRVPLASTQR